MPIPVSEAAMSASRSAHPTGSETVAVHPAGRSPSGAASPRHPHEDAQAQADRDDDEGHELWSVARR
jgi:hypothetical protein